ncbi:MAG: transcriptional regulator [Chitinophagaceae bacterium]|nr:transcriptional regulator [Chitinophagaceae bacterium]
MKKIVVILFFLVPFIPSFSQNTIGIPDIINFTRSTYNAGTQNRGIVQDKNGIVYFANYEGLLSFDGTQWITYPLPNKTIVRSIAIGKDNKIYAGGQDDFGYFSPAKNGKLTFRSLKPLLSEKNYSFTDIWNIVAYGNDIFFRTKEKIFQLSNGSITVYTAPSEWEFLGSSNNQLIAQDVKNGLLEFTHGLWVPFLRESILPEEYRVTAIFPLGKDSSFFTTITTGFYILSNNKVSKFEFAGFNPFLKERILTAIPITEDRIAVGTNLDGCYIINKKGEIIQSLSRKEGLQLNNVLSLFLDYDNNLWLGLDNGIDFIAYNNAIKHIYPEALNEGEGYTSIRFDNKLYLGTSNGVYWVPLPEKQDLSFATGEFISLPETKGSAWNLSEVNGSLLLGHHDGAFQIKNNTLIPIKKRNGYMFFLPLSNVLPSSLLVAGNEIGLDILQFENNIFYPKGSVPGFNGHSQFVAIDNNSTLWLAHPYRGVYKIDINDPRHPIIKLYTDNNGLPSPIKNHLFKIKNRIVVTTEKGIYSYNEKRDSFELSGYFTEFFGQRNIRHLKEDAAGNIWFVEEKNLGVVDLSGSKPETIYFPELNGKMVSGFEHINPYNEFNIFIGSEKGFYHINYEKYKKNKYKIIVKIRSVKTVGNTDSLLFGGYYGEASQVRDQPEQAMPNIAHNRNSLNFKYSSPLYEHQNSVLYAYYLEGFDKDWSSWSKKAEKDYTNLPAGTYKFQVKAKNNLGSESAINSYSFTVLPPWYQTSWAYIMYFILSFIILYLAYSKQQKIFFAQQKKHEEDQKRLQYLHQLEIEKSEKEIVTLKNEKLQSEIEHKNTELASVAMHLVQKGELLANIKEELIRLKRNSNGDTHSGGDYKKLIHILGEEDKMDKDWEHFAAHFDKVHSNFLKTLKASHPTLSAHELKLCAYLVMNLSSKEIAQLMNISVRGVEISRYRLRKKFRIPTETNLFNYLLEFSFQKEE